MRSTQRHGRGVASKLNHHRRQALLIAAATAALPVLALAQDQWVGGSSNWNNPANWSPAAVPANGDTVDVTSSLGLTQTITYDYPGPNISLNSLYIDLTNATPGSAETLNMAGNTLQSSFEYVGVNGVGILNQSGGANYAGTLYLADGPTSTATYVLSGTGTLSVGLEEIAFDGDGTFNQSGGSNFSTFLYVGSAVGGTYNLAGGYIGVGSIETIQSQGTFNQTGGTNASTNFNLSTSAGNGYQLSGGELQVFNTETLGFNTQFNQSGGSNVVLGTLQMNGTLTFSGGTLSAAYINQTGGTFNSTVALTVGPGGITPDYSLNPGTLIAPMLNVTGGTFNWSNGAVNVPTINQSGGLFSHGGGLALGGTSGIYNYNISGGTLSVFGLSVGTSAALTSSFTLSGTGDITGNPNEFVGFGGGGVFTQNSGTNSADGLTVGDTQNGTAGNGVYNLGGGQLSSSATEYIGYNNLGVFNQSGGTNVTTSEMFIGYQTGGNGTYDQSGGLNQQNSILIALANMGTYVLSGGTVQANDIYVGGGGYGTFNQSGGSATATFVYVGYQPSNGSLGPSNYNLSAGNLIASSQEYVGNGSVPALFNQSGGANTAATLNLGSATYVMTSGTLIAGTENLGTSGSGFFNQSGGTNTVSNNLYVGEGNSGTITYTLSGTAAVAAVNEYVGESGTGFFVQNGGSNTVAPASQGGSSDLYIADSAPGSYTLTAGTVAAPTEYVGYNGTASFNQSGGSNTAGTLYLAYFGGASTYILSGGSILATTESIANEGRAIVNQSGGANTVLGTLFFSNNGGNGTYTLSGSGSISVTGKEIIGADGSFSFTQTGGTNTAAEIDLATLGTFPVNYNLSGGTATSTSGVYVGGQLGEAGGSAGFTVSGGTLTAQNITLFQRGTLTVSSGLVSAGGLTIGGRFSDLGGTLAIPDYFINAAGTLVAPTFNVPAGGLLQQSQGTLSVGQLNVSGTYAYTSGAVSISTALTVPAGGTFTAPGLSLTVSNSQTATSTNGFSAAALELSGGAITLASVNVTSTGELEAANGGVLILSTNSLVSGGLILDSGTLLTGPSLEIGNGGLASLGNATLSPTLTIDPGGELLLSNPLLSNVNSPTVTNNGTIDGAGRLTGMLINNGDVNSNTSQSLTFTAAGNLNGTAGMITLTGGVIHFTQDLTSEPGGQISGYGTLRVDGGLTTEPGSTISLGGLGATNIFGTLTNSGLATLGGSVGVFGTTNNSATFQIAGTSPNVFYGAVNNPGAFSVNSGATVLFLGAYTGSGSLSNNGQATFEAGSFSAPITGTGTLTIGVAGIPTTLQLTPGGGTSTQSSLTINPGSTLDLTTNEFLLNYGSAADPIATIVSYLTAGYDGGSWNGTGITSSSVAGLNVSQTKLVYALGYADGADHLISGLSPGQIEIIPTLAGDAKLQGNVVFGDFQILAEYFGQSGGWDEGNFKYQATINFGDFQLLAQDFGAAASSGLTSGELASMQSFAAQFGAELVPSSGGGFSVVAVPEPASVGLLTAVGIGLLARRRRRNRG